MKTATQLLLVTMSFAIFQVAYGQQAEYDGTTIETLMGFENTEIEAKHYRKAVSVYNKDATLTVDGTLMATGRAQIGRFFADDLSEALQYEYTYIMCITDEDCTFKGTYDFGEGIKYDFKITLEDGKDGKTEIFKEVLTRQTASDK